MKPTARPITAMLLILFGGTLAEGTLARAQGVDSDPCLRGVTSHLVSEELSQSEEEQPTDPERPSHSACVSCHFLALPSAHAFSIAASSVTHFRLTAALSISGPFLEAPLKPPSA